MGPNPDGKGAREVTVVPVESEFGLRNRAWVEDNRRKVEQMSGGRLAYVHVPDTAVGGYINFNHGDPPYKADAPANGRVRSGRKAMQKEPGKEIRLTVGAVPGVVSHSFIFCVANVASGFT